MRLKKDLGKRIQALRKSKKITQERLAGQGLKPNESDMIVVVYIEIPSSLSDDEIRLYEKLKKLSSKNIRENILND